MLLEDWSGLVRVIPIAIATYAVLVLVLRLAGKRSLAKLNAFDLVVTVALGSTLATVLLSEDVALAEGALAFAMLAALQWAVSSASIRWPSLRRLVRAEPRLLASRGHFHDDALRAERITRDEVEQAIRQAGLGRIERAAAVVLETDGSLSVIAEEGEEVLTALRSVRGANVDREERP